MPLKPRREGYQPFERIRRAALLTQTELARAIGADQPTISRLECGVAIPTRLQLARLCKRLGARPERLFSEPVLAEVERRAKAEKVMAS